jgi:hypothetical protein
MHDALLRVVNVNCPEMNRSRRGGSQDIAGNLRLQVAGS